MNILGMGEWLFWLTAVLALYSFSSLAVAVVRCFLRPLARKELPVHYLVMTSESGQHLEYLLRRIDWEARLHGRDYRILWQDEGSMDETIRIMKRFQQQKDLLPPLYAKTCDLGPDELVQQREVVLLDLRMREAQFSSNPLRDKQM
jgi:hypothetical protein